MATGDRDPEKLRQYRKEFKMLMDDELNRLKTSEAVNASMDSYFKTLENSREAQKHINAQEEELYKIKKKIEALEAEGEKADKEKIKYFKEQYDEKVQQWEINKKNLALQQQEASLLKASINTLKAKTKEIYKANFGLKAMWGYLQDADKAMKETQVKMGLTGSRAGMLRDNMMEASSNAAVLGVTMGELGRATANFSKELGRSTIPSAELMETFADIGKGTGMSVENVGILAAKLRKAGIPTSAMDKTMQGIVDSTAQMGLNLDAIMTSLEANIGLMNKLHFRDGVEGLKNLIQTAERFRLNVSEIAGLSEKIFRPEGAIELAANLQMMGGAFSRMGDPMTLMFQARNAPEELAKNIAKATAESAIFNKETGKFHFSALEMDRLRQISEMTGQSMESLTESARAAAREAQIAGKLAFNIDDKDKALLASASEFKDGEFKIKLPGGDMVAMKDLTQTQLKEIKNNEKSMKDRAKDAQTFDEAFKAFLETVKTTFLPLIEVLNWLITPIQWFSQAVADLGKFGKILVAGLVVSLGIGGKIIAGWITMATNAAAVKLAAATGVGGGPGGPLKADGTPDKRFKANKSQGGFMKSLSALSPKQMMSLGVAFMLIGTGVAIAAAGLSLFVSAFKDLTPEQTKAVNIALLGFGIAILALVGIMAALVYSGLLPAAAAGLISFGAGVALVGAGVALAAFGISLLVDSISSLDPAQITAVGIGMLTFGAGIAALTASLVVAGALWPIVGLGIGVLSASVLALGAATQSLNTGGLENVLKLSDLSDEKINNLKLLFEAASKAKPLIVFHTPVDVSGTITLEGGGVSESINWENLVPEVKKQITDITHSQNQLQKQGTTSG